MGTKNWSSTYHSINNGSTVPLWGLRYSTRMFGSWMSIDQLGRFSPLGNPRVAPVLKHGIFGVQISSSGELPCDFSHYHVVVSVSSWGYPRMSSSSISNDGIFHEINHPASLGYPHFPSWKPPTRWLLDTIKNWIYPPFINPRFIGQKSTIS